MNTPEEIKEAVKDRYGRIAQGELNSCCSPSSCCGGESVVDMSVPYGAKERTAIPDGADLGLGCGTPAAFADLTPGLTVLDLGSGAGIDCFVAAQAVGPTGRAIGVDMTQAMIDRANANKEKVGAKNVEFRLGEIESLPVEEGSVDRVISNCVINLVPDKSRAFREIFRVLKPGGKFIISDIVIDGSISEEERRDASLWAGCISGATDRNDYLAIVKRAGFGDLWIVSEKKYDYKLQSGGGLSSITLSGTK
jgi:SAM-dependent methyltransferase